MDEGQLREEISFLRRALRTKRRLASLRADRGLPLSPAKARAPYKHGSTKITLLMAWVSAVCDFYNLRVSLEKISCRFHPPKKVLTYSYARKTTKCVVRLYRWRTSPCRSRTDGSSAT